MVQYHPMLVILVPVENDKKAYDQTTVIIRDTRNT